MTTTSVYRAIGRKNYLDLFSKRRLIWIIENLNATAFRLHSQTIVSHTMLLYYHRTRVVKYTFLTFDIFSVKQFPTHAFYFDTLTRFYIKYKPISGIVKKKIYICIYLYLYIFLTNNDSLFKQTVHYSYIF